VRLLIDGHNLIGQMPDISLSDPDDEEQLVSRLRQYTARTGHQVTVYFDGGLPGGPSPELSSRGVQVIFASAGRPADPLIIRRIRQVQDRGQWLVVSSDREILAAAARRRLRVRRAEEFAAELTASPPPAEPDPRQIPPSDAEIEAWLREFTQ
jgi:predicted RNA-binding protein with PIN domain